MREAEGAKLIMVHLESSCSPILGIAIGTNCELHSRVYSTLKQRATTYTLLPFGPCVGQGSITSVGVLQLKSCWANGTCLEEKTG